VRFTSADGRWIVDVIWLSLTGNHRDGECFRIARDGYFVGEARTVAELADYLDITCLTEA
jgi:hypothetical protein